MLSWEIVEGPSRSASLAEIGREWALVRLFPWARDLYREMWPKQGKYDAALCVKPPYPVRRIADRQLIVVLDLRWRRTRSKPARLYRFLNLWVALRRSDGSVCISDRVRKELQSVYPELAQDAEVIHLGPGRPFVLPECRPSRSVDLLLMGGARHKRVESVIESLLSCPTAWVKSLLVVNPSERGYDLCAIAPLGVWKSRPQFDRVIQSLRSP